MRDWAVGYNNVYYTASIILEEVNPFVYYIEHITSRICDVMPGSWFHQYIHMPIFDWYCDHIKPIQTIEIPYFSAKRLFPALIDDEEYIDKRGYYEYYKDRCVAWDFSERFDTLHKELKAHGDIEKHFGKTDRVGAIEQ